MFTVGIPKEISEAEARVSATPETIKKMIKAGLAVTVESGAGLKSFLEDVAFIEAGARIENDAAKLYADSDIIFKIQKPQIHPKTNKNELDMLKPNATFIGAFSPAQNPELVSLLNSKKASSFSLDLLPRIARAQPMDVLSSMTSIAGYKSVILAADHLGKLFPMMTTAAGTIAPAKVIVIGAGVAGLQAIATARRLGGVVVAFDTRPAAAEQVKSLGADFVSLEIKHDSEDSGGYATEQSEAFYKGEQDLIQKYLAEADVLITTALIPGKRAPILITEDMVKMMKPGSVIVDLAIERDGNCILTQSGKIIQKYGVTVIGLLNLPSLLPVHASQFYAKNLWNFLNYILPQLNDHTFDLTDDVIKGCLITHLGESIHPLLKQ